LANALFRLAQPEGDIVIDGKLAQDMTLHDLRRRMSIIPQKPFLFSGTLRKNLDPFGEYNDYDLWHALKQAIIIKNVLHFLPHVILYCRLGSNEFCSKLFKEWT
jgi:ABC-type multidrug transport system fused ATPase/permease subunit